MRTALISGLLLLPGAIAGSVPRVRNHKNDVTFEGLERNGIEIFLNIPYGEDTSGENRFKPPTLHVPEAGSTIKAQSYGPSCPQPLSNGSLLALGSITEVSEDCLNLNVARPKGVGPKDRLPVMVWIHGGGFWSGANSEPTTAPDGLVLESIENGLPVLHVAINYRLGFFGFATSDSLLAEGSGNAGMRDQRLALEWIRDNIANFGGDPERVTIFGQSSGGLAVGLHLLSYGGSKPVPFQRAICESQALEPGLTGSFTIDAFQALVDHVGCNATDLHSDETVECLRDLDTHTLLDSAIATKFDDISHNIGDIWMPVVDGDFLPAAPSELIREGKFAKVPTMMGWTDDDLNIFVETTVKTDQDTHDWISAYVPDVTPENIDGMLSLYPVSDFAGRANEAASAEYFRSARIMRDIIMVCEPIWYAQHLVQHGNKDVYLYDWNQTILEPALEKATGIPGLGPVHTAEFAYIFGNVSAYDVPRIPFEPTPEDFALAKRGSRSWSTFATTGSPSLRKHNTFKGFAALKDKRGIYVFVAGGPTEGLSAVDGPHSASSVRAQKLKERCDFLNSDEMIEQLKF
ncbi:related to para-nitrobenzyl esterase [Cephalotrichum gorgonifer]|uniref:Carboxylic ester hydrolase n=1 Tax=Cephalotrichum gorgonifer TaxID=2041049 RepID=A0AAE8N5T5_9PEZI|nr:related to para-nitrobenzyl esterase [Cephalotrichum gorgonifer]